MPMYSRRDFAKIAATGAPLAWAGLKAAPAMAQPPGAAPAAQAAASTSPWASRVGLELFTVRDQIAQDQVGTLTKVAAIGYKEVEPSPNYGGLEPKQYRALLDRLGLTAPTTHVSVSPGPDLEKQLEGHQIIGHRYTSAAAARPAGGGRRGSAGPAGARGAAGRGAGARGGRGGGGMMPGAPESQDSVKRTVEMYNQVGAVAKKYGMQVLVHQHALEFQRYPGTDQCPYDIILAESDPELVVMELDIGWASVAGQNILEMFHQHPGRFVLWHVKDFMNLNYLFPQPEMNEAQRMSVAGHWMVPVGMGMIDYKSIFAQAELAGMKHFNIEQDSAASWGNSVAAAGVSFQGLLKELA